MVKYLLSGSIQEGAMLSKFDGTSSYCLSCNSVPTPGSVKVPTSVNHIYVSWHFLGGHVLPEHIPFSLDQLLTRLQDPVLVDDELCQVYLKAVLLLEI